jgi:hypothetical protein
LEADNYNGVEVDLPAGQLIVDPTTAPTGYTVDGAPIPSGDLYESVNGGTPVAVSDDIDSGGVYGTIPSSLDAAPGSTITVYSSDGGTELYSLHRGHRPRRRHR